MLIVMGHSSEIISSRIALISPVLASSAGVKRFWSIRVKIRV